MTRTIVGGPFGINQVPDAVTIDTIGNNNYIRVKTGPWLNIFQHAAVIEGDLTNDTLGLYSELIVDGEGKAKFGTMKMPKHLFRPRQNGCVWSPNGKIRMNMSEVDTCPIEFQGEQCPDAFWNSCYEGLFLPGRGVRDLESGQIAEITAMAMSSLSIGLGNSYHELYWFSNHPSIEAADTFGPSVTDGDGGFKVDDEEWEAFYNQMVGPSTRPNNCSGMMTILDALADDGEPGYDIEIPDSDIDADNNYIGDIIALFNRVIDRAKPELRTAARRGIRAGAGQRYPILLVTEPEFRAYEEYLQTNYAQLPGMLQYFLSGTNGPLMVPGALNFKGIPVVSWDASTSFDEIVGTRSHRVALVAPGNFGRATDVKNLRQYDGLGLVTVQKLDPPDNGKIYMDTTLRWGAALADLDWTVYARNIDPS